MFDLIMSWLTEDMQNALGSYTQPVLAALVVGLGVIGCLFFMRLLITLVDSALGGRD